MNGYEVLYLKEFFGMTAIIVHCFMTKIGRRFNALSSKDNKPPRAMESGY